MRGKPVRHSRDNGGECRRRALDAWAADRSIELDFIQPCKSAQNAHNESCNSRLLNECLTQHDYMSLLDALFHMACWRRAYNEDRPHEVCLPVTPSGYARTFLLASSVRQSA